MSRPLLPIERMVLHDRLLEFETLVPMTVSERSALRRWVKGGLLPSVAGHFSRKLS